MQDAPLRLDEQLLTLSEVGMRIKKSKAGVYKMVSEGKLPALKVGGDWRLFWPDVIASLKSQTGKVDRRPRKRTRVS